MKEVEITASMSPKHAEAIAQFFKRAGLGDYMERAASQEEAYSMALAGEAIREALARAGFSPR